VGRLRLKPVHRAPALVAAGCAGITVGACIVLGLGLAFVVGGVLAVAYGFVIDLDRGA
jgi:hypothetical protein